jgi:transcriptional regulator with XRE-family HTH domain
MKQPELGTKINEIRNQKGITQKELSESCNVDIRTIQRIESGEVVPRMSTLKLIASFLEIEMSLFNGNNIDIKSSYFSKILLFSFIIGLINFFAWFFYSHLIPGNNFSLSTNLYLAIVYTVTGVLLYYGIYTLGKNQDNRIIQIASIITMVCIPLFLITLLISENVTPYFNTLIVIVFGMNSIFFGIGLLRNRNQFALFYKIAGILQIVIGPFFILPFPIINLIGLWLSMPFFIIILIILFYEYRETRLANLSVKTL